MCREMNPQLLLRTLLVVNLLAVSQNPQMPFKICREVGRELNLLMLSKMGWELNPLMPFRISRVLNLLGSLRHSPMLLVVCWEPMLRVLLRTPLVVNLTGVCCALGCGRDPDGWHAGPGGQGLLHQPQHHVPDAYQPAARPHEGHPFPYGEDR